MTATIDDPNYQGTASDVLHIAKATATLSFDTSSLTQTYDGTAHFATATTVPAGLTVDIAYQQDKTAVASPTNAGDYDVTATIDDPNYQGTASDVLHIAKATATLSFDTSSLTQTYDGTAHFATATTVPAGLTVDIAYQQDKTAVASPTNAGDYDVTATIDDPNYQGTASDVLHIAKATATLSFDTSSLTQTYDGTAHFATATTVPAGLTVDIAYQQDKTAVASPTNAGDYDVTATIDDPNYQGTASDVLHIAKATATLSFDTSSLTQTYDGTAHFATATTVPAGLTVDFAYQQDKTAVASPTNAGDYDVTATIDDPNYQGTASDVLHIAKATATLSFDTSSLTQTYDGTAHFATATTVPAGLTVDIAYQQDKTAVASPTNAGDYDVTATIDDPNYQGTASDVLHIAKATATLSFDTSSLTQTYDGTAHFATATTVPAGLTVDIAYQQDKTAVASPTNAGDYDVTATIDDPNYQGTASDVLHIAKATATLSFDTSSLTQTYDGTARVVTVTTDPAALDSVSITYDGSATAPTDAGTYALSATLTNANYQADLITDTLTVNKATPVITWSDPADVTYGTALLGTQLNASTTVAGSFVYSPVAGTVLSGVGPDPFDDLHADRHGRLQRRDGARADQRPEGDAGDHLE